MVLVRAVLGEQLRRRRQAQRRTLRDVSRQAKVSLGYLSEVERGHKEPSSELLASICEALDVRLSAVLHEAGEDMRRAELSTAIAGRLVEVAPADAIEVGVVPVAAAPDVEPLILTNVAELPAGVTVDRAA